MKPVAILAVAGVLIVIITLPMPWIAINFPGQLGFSLSNIYSSILQGAGKTQVSSAGQSIDYSSLAIQYLSSVGTLIAALILYPLTLILGLLSIALKKLTIVAGVAGILTGLLWISGIEGLKSQVAQTLTAQGGIFGQAAANLVTSIISVGYGAYVTIIGGIVFVIAFLLRNQFGKRSMAETQ